MHSIAQELARHLAALRGLALDLVGEQAADDVVQDAAVEALRAPPRRPGPVGAWLTGVVRHLASRHRRGERRRQLREQRAARAERVPDDTSSHRELFERLTAAVMALPEPYQDTILRRYLRECSPPEIARDTGVPIATVKTRLQRGLAMLRQRLAREGADWRPALLGAFGLDGLLPRVASAFTPTGVLLMGTGAKVGLGCVALALLAALWWSFGSEPATSSTSAASGPQTTVGGSLTGAAPSPADNERKEVPAGVGAGPLAEGRTMVRGRCVDEQGAPLPHCEVELRGRKVLERGGPDLRREYGEWLVAHPDRVFHDLAAETDPTGRFEFTFDFVPLAYQLRLRRDVPNHLIRVGALQPGEVKDLSDIVLPVSCELHGRVADTNGAAIVTRIRLYPSPWRSVDPTQAVELVNATEPGPDGTFTAHLVAGEYEVTSDPREIVSGKTFTVPKDCVQLQVGIVVAAIGPEDTISGMVVDQHGQPFQGVRIGCFPNIQDTFTDAAGRFEFFRNSAPVGGRVLVFASGRPESGEVPVNWGARDVHLVVTREADVRRDLALRVVADRDGKPVTDFRLHAVSPERDSGLDYAVTRALGDHHEAGLVRLTGLGKGPLQLIVDPDRWDLWMADVKVPAGSASQQVEVRLSEARHRLLRVLREDGSAAQGVAVEQIATRQESFSLANQAYPLDMPQIVGNGYALLLEKTRTDARGEVSLRGPVAGTLVVRLPGPPGLLVSDVRFDTAEPLVVTLPRGARLEGSLGPPALVRELRLALGWTAEGPVGPAVPDRLQIGFRLTRGEGKQAECVPPTSEVPVMVAGEGSFAIDDVPEGTWTLTFAGADENGRRGAYYPEAVKDVELRAGETTRIAIELPEWLTGELEAQLLLNGEPLVNAQPIVQLLSGKEGERPRPCGPLNLRTDDQGRFHLRMQPGKARVLLSAMDFQPRFGMTHVWAARDEVVVPAGGKVSQVFHFVRGRLRLQVLGLDGKAQQGVALLLHGDDGWLHQTTTTSADGWVTADIDVHPFTVQTLPRSVELSAGMINQWVLEGHLWNGPPRGDPFPGQWLTLGRVTPKAGETVEVELRLPPEWDR